MQSMGKGKGKERSSGAMRTKSDKLDGTRQCEEGVLRVGGLDFGDGEPEVGEELHSLVDQFLRNDGSPQRLLRLGGPLFHIPRRNTTLER